MIKEGLFEQKTFEMRRCQLREGLEGRAFLKGLHRRDSSGARWEIGEAWFLPVLRNAQGTHEFLFVCLFYSRVLSRYGVTKITTLKNFRLEGNKRRGRPSPLGSGAWCVGPFHKALYQFLRLLRVCGFSLNWS